MKRITFISDSHSLHEMITKHNDLPGGDIICHTGDFTRHGYYAELENFCEWFDGLKNYTHKIFIAGNHDLCMEDDHVQAARVMSNFHNFVYLEDDEFLIDGIKIWGTPWQPRFYDWAFNLDRNGDKLKEKWELIPNDTDILLTHGPAFGVLDTNTWGDVMGCELMAERIEVVKPKIHAFGHNHHGYGYQSSNGLLSINASVLNERYYYKNKPITIDWDKENNTFNFI